MPACYVGRSVILVAFAIALTVISAPIARSRDSAASSFGSVALASLVAAVPTLASYALSTGYFAHRIVQLREYLRDYTYHGYTSPQIYLSTHYSELLGLQLFSWGIGMLGLTVITGNGRSVFRADGGIIRNHSASCHCRAECPVTPLLR